MRERVTHSCVTAIRTRARGGVNVTLSWLYRYIVYHTYTHDSSRVKRKRHCANSPSLPVGYLALSLFLRTSCARVYPSLKVSFPLLRARERERSSLFFLLRSRRIVVVVVYSLRLVSRCFYRSSLISRSLSRLFLPRRDAIFLSLARVMLRFFTPLSFV